MNKYVHYFLLDNLQSSLYSLNRNKKYEQFAKYLAYFYLCFRTSKQIHL